uniref:Uncharacterized protein n=1 Tax=Ornithorhynchus anatinus TaxID=9258 RepID=A0A6I8NAM7_ORNAN
VAPVMPGDASGRVGLGLLLLQLVLMVVCPLPQPRPVRPHYYVPDDFSAPLELPQSQFGLMDDYGVLPKHPRPRDPPNQARAQAQQKRDESDRSLNYYDDPP